MEDKDKKCSHHGAEGEIDIMEYVVKLWKKRSMIIKCCCVGVIVGLIAGFSIPKTYMASTILAPESEQSSGAGVSGIAAMMGVSLGNSVDAIGVDMSPDIVHSTPFIVGLLEVPVQFVRKDSIVNTTLFDYMANYQKKPWWSPIIGAPMKALGWCVSLVKGSVEDDGGQTGSRNLASLSEKERSVVRFFSENIIVNVDKKTGKTQISLEMQDPLVVYTVVQTVLDHLKEYISDYRTSKVRQDIVNLTEIYEQRKADYYEAQQAYARHIDANKSVVLQSAQAERERLQQEMNLAYQVYSQVATQLETARIKEQETKPVFVVLEPAAIPIYKSAPSKAKLLLLFAFLAGGGAAAWVLFRDDVLAILKGLSEEK